MIRLTRAGWSALLLSALTIFGAASTGNNLLYLLFSLLACALGVSAFSSRRRLLALELRCEAPDRAVRGVGARLKVVILNPTRAAARLLRAAGPDGAAELGEVAAGGRAEVALRLVPPRRGRTLYSGLVLETLWPLGLVLARRRLPETELLVRPAAAGPIPFFGLEADPRAPASGGRVPAADGDFWGPRPYAEGDDARLIHWKLSARTGKLLVVERAASGARRAVVRLEGEDEASVERAASACRALLEAGAEAGLSGPGIEIEPARGSAQLDRILDALALAGEGGRPRPAEAAPAPADEGPRDGRPLRLLAAGGAFLVWAALFLVEELDRRLLWGALGLLGPAFLVRARGGPFPPRLLGEAASALFLAYFLLVDWRRSGVALASAHLVGYLALNRALSAWTREELRQVLLIYFLAFFLASGLTVSPWYLPVLALYAASSAAWLCLQAGAEPAAWRSWVPALGREAAAAAALGAALFLALPRTEGLRRFNPFAASGMDKLQARSSGVTGFTESVTLGRFGALRRSSSRVLRLRPRPAPSGGASPGPVYVRGAAFDAFDGRAWGRPPLEFSYRGGAGAARSLGGRGRARREGSDLYFPGATPPGAEGPSWEVELYPIQLSVLFTVGFPGFVEGAGSGGWFDHADGAGLDESYHLGARYRLRPAAPGEGPFAAADPEARARALRRALEPPARGAAGVRELSRRWTQGLSGPEEKAREVARRLRAGYAYSLYWEGGAAPLEAFLFGSRKGSCEYFASAAAALLREAGVPARLVSGFLAEEWNGRGGFYDVRQSDAHAWVEYWVPGKGWLTLDPTPSAGREGAGDWSRRAARWADALQAAWYRHVVGYDRHAQRDALRRLGAGARLAALRARLGRGLKPLAFLLAAGFLLHAAARALARAAFPRGDEYERAEDALARAGLRREPWSTPREFAGEAAARRPGLSALRELAEAHYARRYGGRAPSAPEKARLKALLAELKAGLRQGV